LLQAKHNDRTIASIEGLRRQVTNRRVALAHYALIASRPAIARAALSKRLQATIGATGGTVNTIEPSQARDGWVGARVTGRMTLAQAATVMARIQNDRPPITIASIAIAKSALDRPSRSNQMEVTLVATVPTLAPSR